MFFSILLCFLKDFEVEISRFMWLKGFICLYLYRIYNEGNYGC